MGFDHPTLAMVIVQVGFAGMNVLSKLAMDDGMSPYVLIAYRQIFAAVVLAPTAFFLERKNRMKITSKILFQIFLCSIFGATLNQLLYFIGLKYSTPTIGCALTNILPAITFVMAVIFRMETVGIRTVAGQCKVIGTAICVGGSMFMTFYQGSLIKISPSPIHWKYAEQMTSIASSSTHENHFLGAMLFIISCLAWAVWFIIQAKMSESFSSPYTSSAILCLMAGVQCSVIAVIFERTTAAWSLHGFRFIATAYTGIIGSGLTFALMSWSIEKRGPLFVSMFNPLLLIFVAILGWAILNEKIYVGSAAGSLLIVGGLYLVLWGKGKEGKAANDGGKAIKVEKGKENVVSEIGLPVYSTTPPANALGRATCEDRAGEV